MTEPSTEAVNPATVLRLPQHPAPLPHQYSPPLPAPCDCAHHSRTHCASQRGLRIAACNCHCHRP